MSQNTGRTFKQRNCSARNFKYAGLASNRSYNNYFRNMILNEFNLLKTSTRFNCTPITFLTELPSLPLLTNKCQLTISKASAPISQNPRTATHYNHPSAIDLSDQASPDNSGSWLGTSSDKARQKSRLATQLHSEAPHTP